MSDARAKAAYIAFADNHPTIHSNRFPLWEEMPEEDRETWRQHVAVLSAEAASVPRSSVDHQQRRGAEWDIVDEAIASYDEWMLDDDFEPHRALREIVERMRTRRTGYVEAASVPADREALARRLTDAARWMRDGYGATPMPEHLEDAAALRQPADGWRPIAEAPRDGSHILVGQFLAGVPNHVTVAHWFDTRLYGAKSGGAGWALSVGEQSDHGLDRLTHWRPLPAPPSSEEAPA